MKRIADVRPDTEGGYVESPRPAAGPLTKPTREHCRQQLSRLNSKFGAPRGEDDKFRLSLVLDALERAESPEHVTRAIDRLEAAETFPNGYVVSQALADTRSREKQPDPKCQKCVLGWVEVPFTYKFGGRDVQTVRAKKCDCWRDVEVSA